MAFKGRSVKIKKDGIVIGGMRSRAITVTNESVDASSDDDVAWKVLHPGAGARYLSLTGVGVFLNDTVIQEFVDASFSGTALSLTIVFASGDYITSDFLVTSFNFAGEHNGALMYNMSLESNLATAADPSITRYVPIPTTWVERNTLTASDAAAVDLFGFVGLSGDGTVLATGAAYNSDLATNAGKMYAYDVVSGVWNERNKFYASDFAASAFYGVSVSLSTDGTVLAVGSSGFSSGNGKVYTYDWNGSAWVARPAVTASDAAASDLFGYGVSLSGDGTVLVIGARLKDTGAGADAGKVYTYDWTGSAWSERNTLTAGDAAAGDQFGSDVSLSSDGLVLTVGAIGKSSSAGAVYVYDKSGTSWLYRTTLTASDATAGDNYGRAVSLSSDGKILAVGAHQVNSAAGKVYIYDYTTSWNERNTIIASDTTASDLFGIALSISNDGLILVVGAAQNNDAASLAGKVYTYDAV